MPQTTSTPLDGVERFLVGLTIFLAPMNALRLPNIYLTAADVCATACIVVMLLNRGLRTRLVGETSGLYFCGLGAFLGALVISSTVSGSLERGLIGMMQYFFAYGVLAFVLIRFERREALMVARLFIASMMVVCAHGIVLVQFDLATTTQFVSATGRLRGLVERENELAALLALTAPLALWMTMRRLMPLWLGFGVVAVLLYTVTLTGSNTGLATFTLAIGVTLLGAPSLRVVGAVAGLLAIGVAVIAVMGSEWLPEIFRERVLGALLERDIARAGTFSDRWDLIMEALRLSSDHLLIGMGVDQYRVLSSHDAPVHNVYLLILNEGGAVAFFGFLTMIAALIFPGIVMLRDRRTFATGIYVLVSVFLFAMVINTVAHVYGRFWVLTLFIAIGLAMSERRALIAARGRAFPSMA